MNSKLLRKQEITQGELKRYLSAIMERQLALGITYINNGELPRMDYVQSTVKRISGFNGTGSAPIPKDLEQLPELSRRFNSRNGLITLNPKAPVQLPACTEPLAYTGEASLRDELKMMTDAFSALKPAGPDTDAALFLTSPSPGTVALFMENQYYPTDEAYLEALGALLKQEYELIAGQGILLQVDCPDLAMGRHTRYSHLTDREFLARIDLNIQTLNHALADIDPDQCRVHICWGNYPGTHHCDIELRTLFDPIAAIDARYISLEASNHRHAHEWTLFKELKFPDDKVLLPGVIDTGSNIVEHPDRVAEQIANFANLLGPDRVIASTDCGFATTAAATSVSGEVAWLKLASLVAGAKRASRRFN
jgi:5-methyltetrahydropteroyltriglutamate--homocysteine methyltransferase